MASKEEMINELVQNLWWMNQDKIGNGTVTEESLREFMAQERERYEAMSEMEIRNMMLINCF